jgi:hypothetical protein
MNSTHTVNSRSRNECIKRNTYRNSGSSLGFGAIATIQKKVKRLKKLGIIESVIRK